MANLINKNDFAGIVKWSANIKDSEIDFHCKDAQQFDVFPIMPLAVVSGNNLLTDIVTAVAESPATKPELVAFFNDFVKPLLVVNAYRRFLLQHGINITQFGLRVQNEETSNEITDKRRGEISADALHKGNVYQTLMANRLKAVSYTFDSIVYAYECNDKPRPKTRIAAI